MRIKGLGFRERSVNELLQFVRYAVITACYFRHRFGTGPIVVGRAFEV
jgi:hypothetical protein